MLRRTIVPLDNNLYIILNNMTSTIGPLLENCCDPCPSCWDECKNTCSINIESTNPECLRVDTSECWVIKLEPKCPKVTYVEAWDNVTIEEVTPPDDCYMDWGDCGIKGWWKVNSTDEKVKACSWDTTPGYLSEKLEEWTWIIIEPQWCDGGENASLRISIDPDILPDIPDIPPIRVNNNSDLVTLSVSWWEKHVLTIEDKRETTYDNMCCIGFKFNQDYSIDIDDQWNSVEPTDVYPWNLCTGNREMATSKWIKILADWHYRVFWQLTVENNISEINTFFNLWRWLLKIEWERWERYVSTAKHWAYGRQVLLTAWNWIDIDMDWKIDSEWSWDWQSKAGFDWPWMTFNIEAQLDLHKWDIITLAYRPQSDMPASRGQKWYFRFVWQNDSSTKYTAIFWGTVLGVHWISPKLFQEWTTDWFSEEF